MVTKNQNDWSNSRNEWNSVNRTRNIRCVTQEDDAQIPSSNENMRHDSYEWIMAIGGSALLVVVFTLADIALIMLAVSCAFPVSTPH